jgi:hypothetical protein
VKLGFDHGALADSRALNLFMFVCVPLLCRKQKSVLLKATRLWLCLLLNFGNPRLEIRRLVSG